MNYEDNPELPMNNPDEKQPPPDPLQSKLTFKRSAILIAVMIVSYQMIAASIGMYFGLNVFFGESEELPLNYYLINHTLGIAWFLIFLGVVLKDIYRHDTRPSDLFNWDIGILIRAVPKVLLFFLPCAVFVGLVTTLTPETEFEFADGNMLVISLGFISAVIMAPIIEEMIFRGYLHTAMLDEFKRPRERIVVNGMLFAAAHMFIVAFVFSAFPYYIFVLGFLFAKLYEETRSILPGILLHGLNNLFVFCLDLYKFSLLQEESIEFFITHL